MNAPLTENLNTGHGWVRPRPDGVKARCGGPNMCAVCAREFFQQLPKVWKTYQRKDQIDARPYVPGEDLSHVSVSPADRLRSTLDGGFIARNPDNFGDLWYIAPEYFAKHYEDVP